MTISLFLSFSKLPLLTRPLFGNIIPLKYQINTKINSWGKVISSFLRRLKRLFHRKQFYKQHQTDIWFKTITVSSLKRSQKKNKLCNWKTCWVKSITTTKSINYKWKAVLKDMYVQKSCKDCWHFKYPLL